MSWIGVVLDQGEDYSVWWGSGTGIMVWRKRSKLNRSVLNLRKSTLWLDVDVVNIRLDGIRDAAQSLDHPGLILNECFSLSVFTGSKKVENITQRQHYYTKQYFARPDCMNIYIWYIIIMWCFLVISFLT